MHGIFKLNKNISVIQMDFIENVSVKMPFYWQLSMYIQDICPCTCYQQNKQKTNLVISCLHNYLGTNGPVKDIVTDNYSGFKSKEMIKFQKAKE